MYRFITNNWSSWPYLIKWIISNIVYWYIDRFDLKIKWIDEIVDATLTSIERESTEYISEITEILEDVITEINNSKGN